MQARAEEAAAGSPSQAKVRKNMEQALDSPSAAKDSSAKPQSRLATSKSGGSGASDKVARMTCWGTSDQGAATVKKPSLAERYSAWKVIPESSMSPLWNS